MSFTNVSESTIINSPSPLIAGRQLQGQLWSNLRVICNLLQITSPVSRKEEILFQHVQFKTGQRVHAIGQDFETLHILNSGFIKTRLIDELGNEQVLSFPMKGDILGLDAIDTSHYTSEAITLSDCDLILVPFKKFSALSRVHIELENILFCVISRELAREREMIGMLGGLGAEARVARFLVALSARYATMGYSGNLFNLRMTREEIGSYLGITLETVSRTLTSFRKMGLITVNRRAIGIKDTEMLKNLRRLPRSRSRTRPVSDALSMGGPSRRVNRAALADVNAVCRSPGS